MSRGRILVVDDDESLRRVMQVQLERTLATTSQPPPTAIRLFDRCSCPFGNW